MKTNKLVQGALIAALFGVLAVLNTMTGTMFDALIGYGMAIPMAIYSYKTGLKEALMTSLASMVIAFLFGTLSYVLIVLSSLGMGTVVGLCLKNKAKKETMLVLGATFFFLSDFLYFYVFSGVLGINLLTEAKEMYNQIIAVVPSLSNVFTFQNFYNLIPLFILIMSFLQSYLVMMLCALFFKRLRIPFDMSIHIATFRFSPKMGYILAIMLAGSMIARQYFGNVVIIQYIYFISILGFMVDGLAFLSFYLIIRNHGRYSNLLIFLVFIPFLQLLLVILGIIDIFVEIRQILYNKYQ